jgi:hypothetical protein
MKSLQSVLKRFGGRLWAAPAFLPYVQPALTDAALREAERSLGVKLPAEYVALLRQQNGGYIRGEWGVSRILRGIGPQYPSLTETSAWWKPGKDSEKDSEDDSESGDEWAPRQPKLLIPFDGDGHWDICLDYRERGPRASPSITSVSGEIESEEPVAPSFIDFLARLEDPFVDYLRVYGDAEPSKLARQVSKALGGAKPTMARFDHGYDVWSIRLPGELQGASFHANVVPTGFSREGQRVVVAKETTLQLPEDPDCKVLLSCSEECERACVDCLVGLGLEVRSAR